MTKVPVLVLLAACGGRATDRAPDAGAVPAPPRDASVPASDAAPAASRAAAPMLPPERDPWSPQGPRAKVPPPPTTPLYLHDVDDAPAPADREVVLWWSSEPVRVHLPIGNWRENRPLVAIGPRRPGRIEFNPSWLDGNIGLELALGCSGACDVAELPANLADLARREIERERSLRRTPRWIVAPHQAGGVWSWKLESRDKSGTLRRGSVMVARVVPELRAYLECSGETGNRIDPVWLDRIEALCRQVTLDVPR